VTRAELLAIAKRGVLFSTQMVQALPPRGNKTRTMRAMKDVEQWACWKCGTLHDVEYDAEFGFLVCGCGGAVHDKDSGREIVPRHKVGDIVYVKETFDPILACKAEDICKENPYVHSYHYKADCAPEYLFCHKWRPSIFMPRAAARTFLRITGIKVQRPKELTVSEIEREGLVCNLKPFGSERLCPTCEAGKVWCAMRDKWISLWDSVQNKKELPVYGYDANPICWVYELESVVPDEG